MKPFVVLMGMVFCISSCLYAQDFSDREVDEAIKKAQDFLLSKMNEDGSWPPFGEAVQKLETLTVLSGEKVPFRLHYYPLGYSA
ncbi:MAG: hypothetical protein JW884_14960, partial [Deltaproteobacteria bacterium]|nr:hypothetical protein [Deltaproteobacteria bacterium]